VGAIFLSYRRTDSACETGRICDRLCAHYGRYSVFIDIDDIPLGIDFRERVLTAIAISEVVLVIIGPSWLSAAAEDGRRRLGQPGDPVTQEVGEALSQGACIVPVLVAGAAMPDASDLPEALRPLAYLNAFTVRTGKGFHHDVDRLIQEAERRAPGLRQDTFMRIGLGHVSRQGINDLLMLQPEEIKRQHSGRISASWFVLLCGFGAWVGVVALGIGAIENGRDGRNAVLGFFARNAWSISALAIVVTMATTHVFSLLRRTLLDLRGMMRELSGPLVACVAVIVPLTLSPNLFLESDDDRRIFSAFICAAIVLLSPLVGPAALLALARLRRGLFRSRRLHPRPGNAAPDKTQQSVRSP
jgi:hypothetical protein